MNSDSPAKINSLRKTQEYQVVDGKFLFSLISSKSLLNLIKKNISIKKMSQKNLLSAEKTKVKIKMRSIKSFVSNKNLGKI